MGEALLAVARASYNTKRLRSTLVCSGFSLSRTRCASITTITTHTQSVQMRERLHERVRECAMARTFLTSKLVALERNLLHDLLNHRMQATVVVHRHHTESEIRRPFTTRHSTALTYRAPMFSTVSLTSAAILATSRMASSVNSSSMPSVFSSAVYKTHAHALVRDQSPRSSPLGGQRTCCLIKLISGSVRMR